MSDNFKKNLLIFSDTHYYYSYKDDVNKCKSAMGLWNDEYDSFKITGSKMVTKEITLKNEYTKGIFISNNL